MNPIITANDQQRAASDPRTSAFVSASAGTGKTKLLTDRLLRLMLAGTHPAKILCLTYTKAAAAEMVLRLNRRLGEWVVKPEAALAAELRALDVAVTESSLALARKLFADVLDLPGGMRIGTIHAFCQSLLRRFPLEAALSPHFEVADDEAQGLRLREAREAVLARPELRDAIFALAAETNEQDFAGLTRAFVEHPNDLPGGASPARLAAMQRAALGAGDESLAALLRDAAVCQRAPQLEAVLRRMAAAGNPSGKEWALRTLEWFALSEEDRAHRWEDWVCAHFTDKGKGTARTLKGFCGKALAAEEEDIKAEIKLECARIERCQEKLKAARLAELNARLMELAAPILQGEQAGKALAAALSYGDLVRYTGKLLIDPGAAWILYKLDGGIDHLLLDEVQDTAPAQWEIASAIADEFFAGEGAREQRRSIFAVGDAKQSIFSFQGADLASFGEYRGKFERKVKEAGESWLGGELSVSFRSTAPVLALVDAVFAEGVAREGVCAPGEVLTHRLSRVGQAGSVTLWPLTQRVEAAELPGWAVPDEYASAQSSISVLARDIAEHIAARLEAGAMLPSRDRPIRPGDFLILVRRRDALVGAMTRALKARGVPVAGLDRMVLTAEPAVSDLLALCDALLLPEDDLAFGQYLASPLGGLSDESLMELALYRRGSLLAALYARAGERADWAAAKEYFEALRGQVDFLTPFALLSHALAVLGGRARMLARLGPEAAEPMEELLSEALAIGNEQPGALQVFVHQLRQSGATIKREAEAAGDVVRIMTVHGAKGLQAPIVILPDTVALPDARETLFWLDVPQEDAQVPIFCPRGVLRSQAVVAAAQREAQADAQEYHRLLYVALTRAEDELLVCGAEPRKNPPDGSWYRLVEAGFARLAETTCAQTAPPDRVLRHAVAAQAALPEWAGAAPGWVSAPPAPERTRPERLAPSRGTEDEAKRAIAASPLATGLSVLRDARAAAIAKGRAVHALLQHLPEIAPAERRAAALRYLRGMAELAGQEDELCRSVLAIMQDQVLFGPGSRAEIPLAGVVGEVEIGGLVDRLAVTENAVWIADYKTDRAPPETSEGIPAGYLRQLAAYKTILAQIYPDRQIHCLLIWTGNARAMTVPPALLSRHAPA